MSVDDASTQESEAELGHMGACKVWSPEHGPRQVFFDVVVRLLFDIDVVNQRFSAAIILNFEWMLSEEEMRQWQKNRAAFKAEWHPPQPEIASAVDVSVDSSEVCVGMMGSMLVCRCSQTVKGTFLQVMELHNFPFDSQDFMLTMTFPESEEIFEIHPGIEKEECVQMIQDPKSLTEYCLSSPILELGHITWKELQDDFSYKEVRHPSVVLRMKASRTWKTHINRVVITLALVSFSVLFAFVVPYDDLATRLAHTTTLFLTAVAYQLVVASSLPQLDYMTLIDRYILNLNIFILAVMCIMALVYHSHKRNTLEAELNHEIDRYSLWICLGLWVLVHLHFATSAAYAVVFIERPKLFLAGARAQQTDFNAGLAAHSRYCMSQDGSQVFFGNAEAYQAATRTEGDYTFWSGTWYSENFYGQHGIEYVYISVYCDEQGQLQLMARKITGDRYVPSGHVTWQTTKGIPKILEQPVPFKVQVRSDISDTTAFRWLDKDQKTNKELKMKAMSKNELTISVDELDLEVGTFHRHLPAEEDRDFDMGNLLDASWLETRRTSPARHSSLSSSSQRSSLSRRKPSIAPPKE